MDERTAARTNLRRRDRAGLRAGGLGAGAGSAQLARRAAEALTAAPPDVPGVRRAKSVISGDCASRRDGAKRKRNCATRHLSFFGTGKLSGGKTFFRPAHDQPPMP